MTIELRTRLKKGWKQEENNRIGHCAVVEFINTKDGKTLFEYAPKLSDGNFWMDLFVRLKEIDMKIKEYIEMGKELDPTFPDGEKIGIEKKEEFKNGCNSD